VKEKTMIMALLSKKLSAGCPGAVLAVCVSIGCFACGSKAQQAVPGGGGAAITASIDASQIGAPVSKYLYGQFIEHIGGTMYGSLWAEMLDDRKFYFPITAKKPDASAQPQGPFSMKVREWHFVGPEDAVAMDKEHPFVGDQSPRIKLDSATPHGIQQAGLALVKDKKYTGRIYLRGTPGSMIKVSLIWGAGENGRQTITIPALTNEYKKFPLAFTAKAESSDATIEITGTGAGSFHIGTLSLMPADNVQGFRPDTTSLLHQIKMGFWRYGGNYTSGLIWYHIVGDIDRRPPDFDNAWGAMQTNDLGLDEFMTLCKLIDVEPYISVNAGFGDSHSAAEEVEYMNGSVNTYMGAKRAKNGHPAPYQVKFWNIGNEPWGAWQLGRTDTKYFMMKHNEFAKAMRAVDPSITLIASGLMLQNDNVPPESRAKYVGNLGPLYGTDSDWDGSFLKSCIGNFDIIAEHWYSGAGHHWDIEKAKTIAPDKNTDDANVKVDQTLLEASRFPADIVRLKVEEWQGYQQRFPWIVEKKISLSIDEYAYFNFGGGDGPFGGENLKQALAYAMILNEMQRYTDIITMGAQTSGVSLIDFNRTASTINGLGLVYKMFGDHFAGAIPVALTGNSPQPGPRFPVGSPDQPEKSSGSPTYPLDLYASLTSDRKYLILSVVNATESEQKVDLSVTGAHLAGPSIQWQLTANKVDALNRVGQAPQLAIKESSIGNAPATITVAPISINIYQFPVAQPAQ
jgi:alpha-N-arabinofuranosidase